MILSAAQYVEAKYSKLLIFILSFFALFLGTIIYILLRPSLPVFSNWIVFSTVYDLLISFRQNSLLIENTFPSWIIYSLPNGLWAFAYAILITGIWSESKSNIRYFWMISIPILVLGFEILQKIKIVRGTYCMQDLAFGLLGAIIGIIIGIYITKLNYHEKEII